MANKLKMPKGQKCVGWKHPGGNYKIIDYKVDEKGLGRIRIHCHVGKMGCEGRGSNDSKHWKRKTDFSNGQAASCGCIKKQLMSDTMREHGDSIEGSQHFSLYAAWKSIKTRVNPDYEQSANYAEKDVAVCSEWENDYPLFKAWALANGWKKGLTIERKDNDLGYSPENCTWATRKTQANNTTRNRRATYAGETKTIAEWSEDWRCRVEYNTLLARIVTYDWDFDRALTTPSRNQGSSKSPGEKARNIYHAMMDRCYNKESPSYANYGGRGIAVCEEWRADPGAYISWHLTNYIEGLDVHRINNQKGYSPENCQFVTRRENNNNRRNSVLLTHDSKTLSAAQWAREPCAGKDVTGQLIRLRKNRGWTDSQSVTIPKGHRRPR